MKILIVDDDPYFSEIMPNVLTNLLNLDNEAFDIIFACDGVMGWSMFDTHKPDIVITDYNMPNMNGCQLLAKIHNHSHKPQKTFLMSNDFDIDVKNDTMFIHKTEIFKMFFEEIKRKTI